MRFNRYVAETQLMYNIDFGSNLPVNDRKISYRQKCLSDCWNNYLCGMFNIPFTITNTSHICYCSDLFDIGLDVSAGLLVPNLTKVKRVAIPSCFGR